LYIKLGEPRRRGPRSPLLWLTIHKTSKGLFSSRALWLVRLKSSDPFRLAKKFRPYVSFPLQSLFFMYLPPAFTEGTSCGVFLPSTHPGGFGQLPSHHRRAQRMPLF